MKNLREAVIKIGNAQYLISEGQVILTDKQEGKKGDKLTFDKVLLLKDKEFSLGKPLVAGAKVQAEIIEQFKDKKILVRKFRAKARYRRTFGHRQHKTKIKILKIVS